MTSTTFDFTDIIIIIIIENVLNENYAGQAETFGVIMIILSGFFRVSYHMRTILGSFSIFFVGFSVRLSCV